MKAIFEGLLIGFMAGFAIVDFLVLGNVGSNGVKALIELSSPFVGAVLFYLEERRRRQAARSEVVPEKLETGTDSQ
jgi:uncharacterized membrane protein